MGTHLARAGRLRDLAAIETALPSIMPLRFGRGDKERRVDRIEQWRKFKGRSETPKHGCCLVRCGRYVLGRQGL